MFEGVQKRSIKTWFYHRYATPIFVFCRFTAWFTKTVLCVACGYIRVSKLFLSEGHIS